ncbi:glycosyltransferase family 2 protein [Aphanothece hegewaldii CCALA 016]|uniref:Glycosyltransferase family 2 protein n=1 Tax=Aphanothece hegewaldii CCALA 016 TaxID=2107694 RepID=A0A2T1M1U5_9CHRO|nr:glycosyltransferase family 2 protein [Aphanothece hegewaldii]PSF38668.1 glycosyltransferase family 2 protein [Aphanothece hegewaldii CCALA 016]
MNEHQPLVSIGMPVYNGESFLKNAIQSILEQTFQDFELIISDNASTDKTQEICRFYAAQDQRIHYYRNEQNMGAAWNQSQVVKLAKGDYFKWAHHDDICATQLLEKSVQVLNKNPSVVLCYPQTMIINHLGASVEKCSDGFNLRSTKPHQRFRKYHHLVRYGNICNPFHGLIRTNILKKTPIVGGYPSSDLVLLGELVLHGEFYEIPETLFFKRDHPDNSIRAYPTYRERIAWYDPTKKNKLYLTKWKWLLEYLRAIRAAPISLLEKFLCYVQMLQWLTWNWLWLIKDLFKALMWPLFKLFLYLRANPKLAGNTSFL